VSKKETLVEDSTTTPAEETLLMVKSLTSANVAHAKKIVMIAEKKEKDMQEAILLIVLDSLKGRLVILSIWRWGDVGSIERIPGVLIEVLAGIGRRRVVGIGLRRSLMASVLIM
jgi:hypothetical protein